MILATTARRTSWISEEAKEEAKKAKEEAEKAKEESKKEESKKQESKTEESKGLVHRHALQFQHPKSYVTLTDTNREGRRSESSRKDVTPPWTAEFWLKRSAKGEEKKEEKKEEEKEDDGRRTKEEDDEEDRRCGDRRM